MRLPREAWVVFTDLDGTLLDHVSYRWHSARVALEALRRRRVPLVLVTSKSRAEVAPLLRSLRRREPFVVENGGAVFLPRGYFPFRIPGVSSAGRGWLRVALGTPRARLLRALASAAKRSGICVRGFAQMSAREVAELTGLPLATARRAREREFDEPFVILDGGTGAARRLRREITREGLQMMRGSRFFHILGDNNKGDAVKKLLGFFGPFFNSRVRAVGLGDSPNDIPLLRAVDIPVLVARPGGRYDAETLTAVPRARRAGGAGPAGWNRAVLRILSGRDLNPHFLFEPRLGTFGRSSSSIFMQV